jgi:hypothetical protein
MTIVLYRSLQSKFKSGRGGEACNFNRRTCELLNVRCLKG